MILGKKKKCTKMCKVIVIFMKTGKVKVITYVEA